MLQVPSFLNYIQLKRRLSVATTNKIIIYYHSLVLQFLLERIHKEFRIKSLGRPDSLGIKWKDLKRETHIYKPLERGEIAPNIRRRIREGRVTKKEALKGRRTRINIRTKRLLDSLKPGKIINGLYQPPNRDQVVNITTTGISFRTQVPYSDEVQSVRPFLPGNPGPWLDDAIRKSITILHRELKKYDIV